MLFILVGINSVSSERFFLEKSYLFVCFLVVFFVVLFLSWREKELMKCGS
jgi:hypothetical protein